MNATTANTTNTGITVCYAPKMILSGGIWKGENPLKYSFPIFLLQLLVIVITSRILHFLLKPFRQPRVLSEILGGLILGPSGLGRTDKFRGTVFPLRSAMIHETMGNVALVYFLFLVGVEMDPSFFLQAGKKPFAIALAGMLLPFIIGCSSTFLLQKESPMVDQGSYILFIAVALSITAFPMLARILAELKLLNMEIGRIAMSSAIINDLCCWILLALAVAIAEKKTMDVATFYMILSSVAFVILCFFVVRPVIMRLVEQTPDGEAFSESTICLILAGVMISGFITDAIGTHAIFGAFIFGLVIPNGSLAVTLIEKLEDFVTGILLPIYFSTPGLKIRITEIKASYNWIFLVIVVILAYIGKIAGTLVVALFYKMPLRDAITLGFLMNAKGVIEMVILNVAKKHNVLDENSFAIMIIMIVSMTGLIAPVVTTIYKPARRLGAYRWRAIQRKKDIADLRVLVCIHTPRNVATIINLLEASNPNKQSPICILVLHLIELTGRASSMLMVHSIRESGQSAINQTQPESDHIIKAFKNLEMKTGSISVNYFTANSPYSTMHEDICNLAEDKCATFIIIPFHKQQTVDGRMAPINPAFRTLNQNVLGKAPCSVGILIDRGLSGSTRSSTDQLLSHRIAVLFFGGPNDREALAYAVRMAEGPANSLSVIRFLPSEHAAYHPVMKAKHEKRAGPRKLMTLGRTEEERQKQLDDDYIGDVRMGMRNDESFIYREMVVNNGEETLGAIRSVDDNHDLFIVGRGQGTESPLTAGLTDWSECPELGVIGDLLASSDFAVRVSVLIMQQYVGVGPLEEGM